MTDAYDTLREMLANVPDHAQVYVEELESIVEWPGITAGTFRQLLAEIAGFESMWEAREKAHDAEVATLRAQLATAKREVRREYPHLTFCNSSRSQPIGPDIGCVCWNKLHREYPATPSGETKCADVAGCDGKCCAMEAE
jgi:hypothetical protein